MLQTQRNCLPLPHERESASSCLVLFLNCQWHLPQPESERQMCYQDIHLSISSLQTDFLTSRIYVYGVLPRYCAVAHIFWTMPEVRPAPAIPRQCRRADFYFFYSRQVVWVHSFITSGTSTMLLFQRWISLLVLLPCSLSLDIGKLLAIEWTEK